MGIRNFNLFIFLRSRKLAFVLLALILFFSLLGVILPKELSLEAIFSSLWFNSLLVLLIVNILFCTLKRVKHLRVSLIGSTIFHFSFVLLTLGVVYDRLFFFEGGIRLTEGESLSCAKEENYDWVRMGRFFKISKLKNLGEIYFHKLYPFYYFKGEHKGVANKIVLRPVVADLSANLPINGQLQQGGKEREAIIYANRPLKYKKFEFYRGENGVSPLFVFRDRWGRVLDGAYVPMHTLKRKNGTYLYEGGFPFPPGNPLFGVWAMLFPPTKNEDPKVFLEVRRPTGQGSEGEPRPSERGVGEEEIFKGKIGLKERAPVGPFFISVDEVRYWSRMKVIYRPGLFLIFNSFWLALGGISLSTVAKMVKRDR